MTTVEKYQMVLVVRAIGPVIRIITVAQIYKSNVRIVSIAFYIHIIIIISQKVY